jgi:anti-sigma factor RsiW
LAPREEMTAPCQRIADLLSEFLDGELGPRDQWEVMLHLEGCVECTRCAAELAATIGALHGLRGDRLSRGSQRPGATTWRSTAPPSPGRSRPSSS